MRILTLTCLALLLAAISTNAAIPNDNRNLHLADARYKNNILTNTGTSAAKSDTIYLFGGPDSGTGKFQQDDHPLLPDDEGWIGVDITARATALWHIDTFMAPVGGHAIWCGEVFTSCGGSDAPEGYGNSYREQLDWSGIVADNSITTDVTLEFDLNYDNEPGYDYLYIQFEGAAGMTTVATYNGVGSGLHPVVPITIAVEDYLGPDFNEIRLRFHATSDGAWSDADCLWPTSGHSQIDNISVSGTNGLVSTFDDFESGMPASNWQVTFPTSIGDFSRVWPNLYNLDPCNDNPSPQLAFIDDGVVVPCTGGSPGTTWTYGPGGYTHNLTGGCAGPAFHSQSEFWSPVIDWADESGYPLGDTYNGANFSYDVYPHLLIGNGMFYVWHVRSMSDSGVWSEWQDRNFVYYGPARFQRDHRDITDLLVVHPTKVQLALGINELGWIWGLEEEDGTPGPYFDNVALAAYQIQGPSITTRELQMAQDGFPAIGTIDYENLGNNSIRFDMAKDINGSDHPGIMPGDSITFTVTPTAHGAILNAHPELHYTIKANPLFNPYRTAPITGLVQGDTAFTTTGVPLPNVFAFDLPDTGMLFPGDILHYYIHAEDNVGGVIISTTLPEDPVGSGYGVFPGEAGFTYFLWPSSYTVHGLPTMFSDYPGDQPKYLFYQDCGDRSDDADWIWATYSTLCISQGLDYDIYYTNAPSSGVSNGLGAKATLPQISGYDAIIYSCGDQASFTLNVNNQSSDKSDDISLLSAWLGQNRQLLATGDNLVSDLINNGGISGAAFASTWLGVELLSNDVSPLIGGQTAPLVLHVPGNTVRLTHNFTAYGACPTLNTFDEVSATTAEEIAEWTDTNLQPIGDNTTTAAAGFLNIEPTSGSDVVFFPVDFMSWHEPHDNASRPSPSLPADVDVLNEIMNYFGYNCPDVAVGTPQAIFSAQSAPNPFNPATEIKWTITRPGDLSIKVYNVRGELVTTLRDGHVDVLAGTEIWRGENSRGAQVASGVYFYEVRSDNNVIVNKMTLLK